MSEKKENPDNTADNQAEMVISASAADASSDSHSDKESSHKKSTSSRGKIITVIILIILIVAGALATNGQLQSLIESTKTNLASLNENGTPETTPTAVPAAPEPDFQTEAAVEADPAPETIPEAEPAIQPEATSKMATEPVTPPVSEPPAIDAMATISSNEISALLTTIDSLRGELSRMEESQYALRTGLSEQQHMNLQVRLRWITDPASRLPQIQLAWEEISLMVNLTAEQRATAEQMHVLARDSSRALRNWQDALVHWADALSVPTHEDILPQPEHPWLAWIVGQFHLRQAPTIEARRLASLRTQLLMVARQLSLESWPEQGAWQTLHAELLLQLKAMRKQDESLTVELGLPDNFEATQADINRIRKAAKVWAANAEGTN